jgi:hypothetical protein
MLGVHGFKLGWVALPELEKYICIHVISVVISDEDRKWNLLDEVPITPVVRIMMV